MEQPVLVFGNPHSKESFFLHSYGISCILICAHCLLSFRWALQGRVSLCLLYPLPSLSPAVVALSAFPSVVQMMKNLEHLTLIYSSEWILCWTHSSMSMSFLHWGAQHWLQPASYGLTRNEKRRITPLDLQTLFFLVQPRMLLALFATRAQEKIITAISSPLWTISTVQLDFSNVLLEDKFPTRMKVSLKGSQQNGKHSLHLGIWSMPVSFLWIL